VAKRLETARPVAKLSGEPALPPPEQLQLRLAPNLLHWVHALQTIAFQQLSPVYRIP
jgi:hypothetical protein